MTVGGISTSWCLLDLDVVYNIFQWLVEWVRIVCGYCNDASGVVDDGLERNSCYEVKDEIEFFNVFFCYKESEERYH
jgi:hypothetical protein